MTITTTTVYRMPIYSTVQDEAVNVTIPADDPSWGHRLSLIEAREVTLYGPKYRRGVVEALVDVSLFVKREDLDAAERYLVRAEYLAGVRE